MPGLDLFDRPPPPPSALGRYRILSKNAGIRVSPLQLGAMSLGNAWEGFMSTMTKEEAFKLLDEFVALGGNFIDTANNYQNEQSETWIGEWMAERKNRDRMVIATKFTLPYRSYADGKDESITSSGNNRRSLHVSVRDSLKKLQTDWIDILYLHIYDWSTSVKEIMDSLDALVKSGKVLYLDTPAWVVSWANSYAQLAHKTEFSIYQGRWNVLLRDLEREILPMAKQMGMAIAVWDGIGGGRLVSPAQREKKKQAGNTSGRSKSSPIEDKMSELLCQISAEHDLGDNPQAIALAYLLSKAPYVFPIIGGSKIEYLHANLKSLEIKLTQEQIERIEAVQPFDVGFPNSVISPSPHEDSSKKPMFIEFIGNVDFVINEKAIGYNQ